MLPINYYFLLLSSAGVNGRCLGLEFETLKNMFFTDLTCFQVDYSFTKLGAQSRGLQITFGIGPPLS